MIVDFTNDEAGFIGSLCENATVKGPQGAVLMLRVLSKLQAALDAAAAPAPDAGTEAALKVLEGEGEASDAQSE